MKLQWFGCGHQSKQVVKKFDHFGLSNFHRLKFRTSSDHVISHGETKSFPTLAVLSSGVPTTPEPAYASRTVVREFTNDFRHDGRMGVLDPKDLEKWLRFKIDDLHYTMAHKSSENPKVAGFSASLTTVVFLEKRAIVAQLGDTHLFHLRKGNLLCPSEQEWQGIICESEAFPVYNLPSNGTKPYKTQFVGSKRMPDGAPAPLIFSIELKKNDVLCLGTHGLVQMLTREKLKDLFGTPRSQGDLQTAVERLTRRASELNAHDSIAALMLRVR